MSFRFGPGSPPVGRLPLRSILAALQDPYTYNLRRNSFTLFGFLWGLPLSVLAIFLDLWVIGHPERLEQFWREPVHLLFLLHPFLFGIVFGAAGTVHAGQDREIGRLLEEQRRHLKELADANEDMKHIDELKSQFVANVTHELKTPLVAIKGYNESILEERFGPLTPKQREGLGIAVRNIVRLQSLIEQILEFERIESSGYQRVPVDFDLVSLIRLVLSNFQPQMDEKHLSAELSLPVRQDVRADYEGIRRVLLNLLSNAVKFSDRGGSFGVDVRVPDESGEVEVGIWDRGPGIPESAQRFLFSRFWQADGSSRRRHGGTGLGLAIVKGILDAHETSVRVISSPGTGTTLKFRLRRALAAVTLEESPHGLR